MSNYESRNITDAEQARPDVALQPLPIDGGRDAWLVLSSCFMLGALVWGFPFSFGVFQEYYSRQQDLGGSTSIIAAIGTSSMGIMYLTAPIIYSILQRCRSYRKIIIITGFIIMLSSLAGASFANTVVQLLVTQGILYGLGGSLLYFPIFSYVDEWFLKHRGLAFGVMIAGDGAGGIVIPFVMEWILSHWGFRTALRVWAIVCLLLTTPALFFLKSYPSTHMINPNSGDIDFRFLTTPTFWILQAGNFIQGLGHFMPLLYMPSFAATQNWPTITGTIAVSLYNAAIVLGATIVGWLTDRYHVTTVINICTCGTLISVFIFWGFSIYPPVFYTFAITYGLFAGGFPATWAGCSHPIRRRYPVETGMIIALFNTGKGISSVISGPLSGVLEASDSWRGQVGYAYGSGYGYMIIFSGVTTSFASIGWVGKKLGLV